MEGIEEAILAVIVFWERVYCHICCARCSSAGSWPIWTRPWKVLCHQRGKDGFSLVVTCEEAGTMRRNKAREKKAGQKLSRWYTYVFQGRIEEGCVDETMMRLSEDDVSNHTNCIVGFVFAV
jgi:hypothetical protein